MWGYDVVSDSVVMWIGPALIVLAVLSVQLMLRWPVIGGVLAGHGGRLHRRHRPFSNSYVLRRKRRSVALDSRIGGALADAISLQPDGEGLRRRRRARKRGSRW